MRALAVIAACTTPAAAQHIEVPTEYLGHDRVTDAIASAVGAGEIEEPSLRLIPHVTPRADGPIVSCVTTAQIFPFEDTNALLSSDYSTGALLDLMSEAANAVLVAHGDNYDFIGYWLNFDPHHTIGGAFYASVENDVRGIGKPLHNSRPALGLAGNHIEGYVMMWNINSSWWRTGSAPNASTTRLVLAQEFEHRFAMALPPLLDGRVLQGDDASCGRSGHWSFRVDGQGSGMEISEWIGDSPATRGGSLSFNTDIPGSVFSYPDLYLMGYVSPEEMDAGMSELRFMDDATCTEPYFGTISTFTSADIIAAAGRRRPDHTLEDHHYRIGWVMFHQPGDEPDATELNKAAGILTQHELDWERSTLGRGSISNTLFNDCDCDGIEDPECGCNEADVAAPLGQLDAQDMIVFLQMFNDQEPGADISAPHGTWDYFDLLGFIFRLEQGCGE